MKFYIKATMLATTLFFLAICTASKVPADIAKYADFTFLEFTGCSDSSYARMFVDAVNDCVSLCRGDGQCAAFSVNTRNLRCYLKASCAGKEPKSDNFSGIKVTRMTDAALLEDCS